MKKRTRRAHPVEDVHSFNRVILEIDVNGFTAGNADLRIDRALTALLGVRGGAGEEVTCVGFDCNGYNAG